ncbi:hypothetical protein [Paenibacillus donghaensis]|uniref:Prophage tail endopeptidase domain-containing protein n=1 Tax=Paenibacillus donghaensis TaxID=414771 RepID=A0A2Z2KDE4_9BACL|nr:hypothetical protein [Paenibacillus donghaensis]ASA21815.1 hypothetical protein B9T62_14155 [Paenibacillus donghaensis]
MSQCVAKLYRDFIEISADSRGCAYKNGQYLAMDDEAKKIEQVGNKVIFQSGSQWVVSGIVNHFKSLETEKQTIDNLRTIAIDEEERFKKEYPKQYETYNEKNRLIELLIATFEDGKGIIYNISSTENFKIVPIKGRIHEQTICLGPFTDYINSHFNLSNYLTVHLAYESVACEQVGGWHEYYKLTKDKIEYQKEKIKDTKIINYYDEKLHGHLNATDGIKITSHGEPVFYVDTYGTLRANDLVGKRLKITTDPFGDSSEDVLLLDADERKLYLNRWDIVGAGAVDAKLISANMVSAELGYISDIIAKSVSTMTRAAIAGWSNFIEIKDKTVQWVTGRVTQGEHISVNGKPMYWVESSETGLMTNDVTPWPVYKYVADKDNKKVKMEMGFDGEGDGANPYIDLGIGDGSTPRSGKGRIAKQNGGMKIEYDSSNYGFERSVDLRDEGIVVNSEKGYVNISAKDINAIATGGGGKFGNDKAYIEMTPEGKMIFHAIDFDFINN